MGARIEGLARQDIYELPIRTIREMISNAVCHRSYLASGKVQVALFDDRLEVTSPGMLDRDLTLEKIRQGQSKIRNKGIAAVFSYMNIIEAWGSGIPKMFEEAESYGLSEPELIDMGSDFRVNLYRKKLKIDEYGVIAPKFEADYSQLKNVTGDKTNNKAGSKTSDKTSDKTSNKTSDKTDNKTGDLLTETEQMILDILYANAQVTQKQIAAQMGVSYSGVRYAMNTLKEKGKIIRNGTKKNGSWKIVDQHGK